MKGPSITKTLDAVTAALAAQHTPGPLERGYYRPTEPK